VEKIVPRWEWRTFGQEFGAAEAVFAGLESERVQESDEVYLLSPACDANVKVRDGLMDIKLLEQVDAAGLEQWRPVMKGAFPLAADEAKKVCAALGVTAPSTTRTAYSLQELEAELCAPARGIRVVPVHKRRVRSTLHGCMSEITDLVADGKRTRTVALEAEDAGRVIDAVRAVGLAGFPNTSYPRGLKRLLGMKS
jgi:exopolyphosphatase / guanosine-5'-triphosphate,3'-diphosphate pyrophosphatase